MRFVTLWFVGLMLASSCSGLRIQNILPSSADQDPLTCASLGWQPLAHDVSAPRVFDAFLYTGIENLLLEARMMELDGVVDRHVLGSTSTTLKGEPRAHSLNLLDFAAQHSNRIHEVHIETGTGMKYEKRPVQHSDPKAFEQKVASERIKFEGDPDFFHRESFARNSLANGIDQLHAADDDWVILSDADEIPDANMVRLLKNCQIPNKDTQVFIFRSHRHYLYNTGCNVVGGKSYWTDGSRGPTALRVRTMRKFGLQAARIANVDCYPVGPYASCRQLNREKLPPSAWHLSSFFNEDMLAQKGEQNSDDVGVGKTPKLKEAMENCMDTRVENLITEQMPSPRTSYPDVPHSIAQSRRKFCNMTLSCNS